MYLRYMFFSMGTGIQTPVITSGQQALIITELSPVQLKCESIYTCSILVLHELYSMYWI